MTGHPRGRAQLRRKVQRESLPRQKLEQVTRWLRETSLADGRLSLPVHIPYQLFGDDSVPSLVGMYQVRLFYP